MQKREQLEFSLKNHPTLFLIIFCVQITCIFKKEIQMSKTKYITRSWSKPLVSLKLKCLEKYTISNSILQNLPLHPTIQYTSYLSTFQSRVIFARKNSFVDLFAQTVQTLCHPFNAFFSGFVSWDSQYSDNVGFNLKLCTQASSLHFSLKKSKYQCIENQLSTRDVNSVLCNFGKISVQM